MHTTCPSLAGAQYSRLPCKLTMQVQKDALRHTQCIVCDAALQPHCAAASPCTTWRQLDTARRAQEGASRPSRPPASTYCLCFTCSLRGHGPHLPAQESVRGTLKPPAFLGRHQAAPHLPAQGSIRGDSMPRHHLAANRPRSTASLMTWLMLLPCRAASAAARSCVSLFTATCGPRRASVHAMRRPATAGGLRQVQGPPEAEQRWQRPEQ